MALKDHHGASLAAREALQAPREVDLLAGEQLLAETADLAERARLAEHERTGGPARLAAERVPGVDPESNQPVGGLEGHRGAAADTSLFPDTFENILEQRTARIGIRVDEDQPVAARSGRAAVAGARDLVDRLEDHRGARGARDLRGAVGRVVVTHDQFRGET